VQWPQGGRASSLYDEVRGGKTLHWAANSGENSLSLFPLSVSSKRLLFPNGRKALLAPRLLFSLFSEKQTRSSGGRCIFSLFPADVANPLTSGYSGEAARGPANERTRERGPKAARGPPSSSSCPTTARGAQSEKIAGNGRLESGRGPRCTTYESRRGEAHTFLREG